MSDFNYVFIVNRRRQWPCMYGVRLRGLWVRNAPGVWILSVVSVVCCRVEVSATGRSLVQRSPTDCGLSVGDRDTSIMGGLGAVVP